METGDPLVSIIIPVYNGENYLREAIDSALAQTYENIEIIVVNDGSTDSTEEIALSYGDRIRYFNKPNGGVSSALNLAIDNMRGEYFSWLSHDDRYLPDKVLKSVSAISSPDEVVLCNHKVIDENGHPMRKGERNHRFADRELVSGEKAVSNLMRYGAYNGCSLLIPRESFEKCGGFDETMRFAQDMMMWIRIFLSGYSLRYLDDQLVQYRQHSAQVTLMRQDLFHHDSEWMSEFVIPLLEKSDNGLLFEYALFNARYDNPSVVESCCEVGIFSLMERFVIRVVSLYGIVRPLLKRIWLKIA